MVEETGPRAVPAGAAPGKPEDQPDAPLLRAAEGTGPAATHAIVIVRRTAEVSPVHMVAGLAMLTRLLHSMADAGVRVATLFGELTPDEFFKVLDDSLDGRIVVDLARSRVGETELLAVRRLASGTPGPVLLVRSDAWVEPAVLRSLAEYPAPETVVATAGGAHTGIARVSARSVAGLGDADELLNDLVVLAEAGRVRAHDATGRYRRVRTAADVAAIERDLLEGAISAGEPLSPMARKLRAPLVAALARPLADGRLEPSKVASGSVTLGVLGAVAVALGAPWAAALGALLFLAGGVLGAGVEPLARLRRRTPPAARGATAHAVALAYVAAATLHVSGAGAPGWLFGIGTAAVCMGAVAIGLRLARSRRAAPGVFQALPPEARRWLAVPLGRDFAMLALPLLTWTAMLDVAVIVACIVAAGALAVQATDLTLAWRRGR